jgi:hypothetical protein
MHEKKRKTKKTVKMEGITEAHDQNIMNVFNPWSIMEEKTTPKQN